MEAPLEHRALLFARVCGSPLDYEAPVGRGDRSGFVASVDVLAEFRGPLRCLFGGRGFPDQQRLFTGEFDHDGWRIAKEM